VDGDGVGARRPQDSSQFTSLDSVSVRYAVAVSCLSTKTWQSAACSSLRPVIDARECDLEVSTGGSGSWRDSSMQAARPCVRSDMEHNNNNDRHVAQAVYGDSCAATINYRHQRNALISDRTAGGQRRWTPQLRSATGETSARTHAAGVSRNRSALCEPLKLRLLRPGRPHALSTMQHRINMRNQGR
jgi:hypothetical protein